MNSIIRTISSYSEIMKTYTYIIKRSLSSRRIAGLPEADFRQLCESMSPYIEKIIQLKIVDLDTGKLVMHWPYRKEFIGNPIIPCLHGGVAASIIDHVGGFCAWSSLTEANKLVNTVDLRIDYLRPAPLEDILCEASVVDISDGGRLSDRILSVGMQVRRLRSRKDEVYTIFTMPKLMLLSQSNLEGL